MKQVEKNYLKSIELLGEQIRQSYFEAKVIKLPKNYSQVNKIICCGMGGSLLGVDLVCQLFNQEIKLPLIQVRGYDLPRFVDSKTLVFLLSVSGDTEEVLAMAKKAKQRRSKIIAVASGGQLAKFSKKNKIPAYIYNPVNNPTGKPRMGTGYPMGAVLCLLKKLSLIDLSDNQVVKMVNYQKRYYQKYQHSRLLDQTSLKLKNKIPIIVTSEFLQGNAHILTNQLHESAKQFAVYHSLPEFNHHLLEGLTFPKENKKYLYFLFFYSKNYHPRTAKRYRVTQQTLTGLKISYSQIEFKGDKISQSMEMLVFGSLLGYQVAKNNKINPTITPWVDYFKEKLKK